MKRDRAWLLDSAVAGIVVLVAVALLTITGVLARLDAVLLDVASRALRREAHASPKIALVLIDEPSLETLDPAIGGWPWPRAIYQDLLEFLAMGRSEAVLFDLLFTEHQGRSVDGGLSEDDRRLSAATASSGLDVFHASQLVRDSERSTVRTLPEDYVRLFALPGGALSNGSPAANDHYLPFDELYRAARGVGSIDAEVDVDGIHRTLEPVRTYDERSYPSLALAPFAAADRIALTDDHLLVDGREVPVDSAGRCWLNFYGHFETYSAGGLLASLQAIRRGDLDQMIVDPAELAGKWIFVGGSAAGLKDLKPNPLQPAAPGVLLHATLASNLLEDEFLRPPRRVETIALTLLCFVLTVASLHYSRDLRFGILAPSFLPAAFLVLALVLLQNQIALSPSPPLAAILLSWMGTSGLLTSRERRERLRIERLFSRYVSPEIVGEILAAGDELEVPDPGSLQTVTVLFSDIRGFTAFSEDRAPATVVALLNTHFSHMARCIHSHRGTIDKYIGDAIMAFWGAPLRDGDHALAAVDTARAMLACIPEVNRELRRLGIEHEIHIGIGIHTGEAILGNIGSQDRLDYTVIGDTVNLASRLEALTKTYDCPLVLSEATRSELPEDYPLRFLDEVAVRGKAEPVRIYGILDPSN